MELGRLHKTGILPWSFPCRRRGGVWFKVWADEVVLISPSHWRIWQSGIKVRAHIYKEHANRTGLAALMLAPGFRAGATPLSAERTQKTLDDSAAGWRRGRDSNPRYSLRPYDALAKRCLQPLGHLSGASLMHLFARAGQFGSACFRSNIPSDFRNKRVCSRGARVAL